MRTKKNRGSLRERKGSKKVSFSFFREIFKKKRVHEHEKSGVEEDSNQHKLFLVDV